MPLSLLYNFYKRGICTYLDLNVEWVICEIQAIYPADFEGNCRFISPRQWGDEPLEDVKVAL